MATLQNDIQNMQRRIDALQSKVHRLQTEVSPAFPTITKFSFRQLLTPEQLRLWDNWKDMELGLTQEEKWDMNTFFKSFDAAEKVTMTDPLMQNGMEFFVTKGLITQEEADRILAGQQPVTTETTETTETEPEVV